MADLFARSRVLLSAAVTWITLAGAIVAIVLAELAPYADRPAVEWSIRILGGAATVLAVSASIVRRVTPVLPAERGILPPPPPPA